MWARSVPAMWQLSIAVLPNNFYPQADAGLRHTEIFSALIPVLIEMVSFGSGDSFFLHPDPVFPRRIFVVLFCPVSPSHLL